MSALSNLIPSLSGHTIAVDFDDTVAGFNEAFLTYHNKRYGTTVTLEDITTYIMTDVYGVSWPELLERVRDFCHQHHDTITPMPEAKLGLARLAETHTLHMVTSRCHTLRKITGKWLAQHGITELAEHHFTNGFGFTAAPKRTKLEVCTQIGASLLIDDAPEHAHSVASAGLPVIVMERPWNRTMERHPNIYFATDWNEVVHLSGMLLR